MPRDPAFHSKEAWPSPDVPAPMGSLKGFEQYATDRILKAAHRGPTIRVYTVHRPSRPGIPPHFPNTHTTSTESSETNPLTRASNYPEYPVTGL